MDVWSLMELMCLDILGVACYGVIQCADVAGYIALVPLGYVLVWFSIVKVIQALCVWFGW